MIYRVSGHPFLHSQQSGMNLCVVLAGLNSGCALAYIKKVDNGNNRWPRQIKQFLLSWANWCTVESKQTPLNFRIINSQTFQVCFLTHSTTRQVRSTLMYHFFNIKLSRYRRLQKTKLGIAQDNNGSLRFDSILW